LAVAAPDLAATFNESVDGAVERGGADTRRHRAGRTVPGAREGRRHRVRAQHLSSGYTASRGDAVCRRSDQSRGQRTTGHHAGRTHPRHVWPRHVRPQSEPTLRQGILVQHRHQRAGMRGQIDAQGEEDRERGAHFRRDRRLLQLGVVAGGESAATLSHPPDIAGIHGQGAQRQD